MSYGGTVLLVSHDREFLDHVVTSCYVMPGNGEVLQVAGGYAEASRAMSKALASAEPKEADGALAEADGFSRQPEARHKKLSYKEQRELETLEKDIETLTEEKADLESKLQGGLTDVSELQKVSARFSEVSEKLDVLETRWLELSI